ncbi:response regulator [Paraburkholderia sp. BL10I2N1]|uniref:response regulator transcription factor n=1 Tax=Paraburkholderia sp. BL10I2N1 TaxID=1938796 RepID=UPI00105F0511|nr:response regulator [Paraburkholderia sp. BL10I2N1]TDN57822.1 response regulator receiver domain-containing protein [Paraburkholderia sp. BL10I2N1]
MGNLKPTAAVVDDDESVGRAIKRLLRSVGIEAEVFTSGEAFLDTLSSLPSYQPDCVILDIQMPGTNGLEIQHQLVGRGMPVIMITAGDDALAREQALAAGAVGYLRKPFNGSVLIRIVQGAMGLPPTP